MEGINPENVNPHLNDPAHPLSDNQLQHVAGSFTPAPVQPCPSCGHCPTCGRRGWNQGPVWYTWPNGTWVCGSGTTAMGTPNA